MTNPAPAHAAQPSAPDTPTPASQSGRMECGVCWYVYDPAQGDDYWQIEPGVDFHDLPDHWRCPECDQEKSKFLPLDDSCIDEGMQESSEQAGDKIARIVEAYKRVDLDRMQDLPFRNDALSVDAVGFRDWGADQLGVIITPWFINLVLVPGEGTDWSQHRHGDKVAYTLPSGVYEFVHGDLEDFGPIQSCSLMSPVTELENHDTARLIAEEVMRLMVIESEPEEITGQPLLSAVPEPEEAELGPKPNVSEPISRRELLRGRRDAKKTSEENEP